MKSSYVLIIVIFVILVSATVIAKLGSQIQLAPRRAPITDFPDDEPETTEEEAKPVVVAPVDFITGMNEGRFTATIENATLLVQPAKDQDIEKFNVTAGTLLQNESKKNQWIIAKSLELSVADATPIPVFTMSIKDLPTDATEVQPVAPEPKFQSLVESASFSSADPKAQQLSVWAVNKVALTELEQTGWLADSTDPRVKGKVLPVELFESLDSILEDSSIDLASVPLTAELAATQSEEKAAQALTKAWIAFDDDSADQLSSAMDQFEAQASSLKIASPIIAEAGGLKMLRQFANSKPTLKALPSTFVKTIDKTLAELKQTAYPTADLETRLTSTINNSVSKCQQASMLGEVVFLLNRLGEKSATHSVDQVKLSAAMVGFFGAYQRQLTTLEDDSILPNLIVNEAKSVFAPDEKSLSTLDRMASVPLEDIPKSKQRDVIRQMSLAYLELAEVAAANELPSLTAKFAQQAIDQQIKAPGVKSKAQRMLRTLKVESR